jgi:predicted nucleic acid-binding protein
MPEIVCDCCVLSNFAVSRSLPVIKRLYGSSAVVTDFVMAEIRRGFQAGHKHLGLVKDALDEGWLEETSLRKKEERVIFRSLSVSLGLGEASSIAVAKVKGYLFACDDRTARREAGLLGVKLTGTLGILKKAVRGHAVKLKDGGRILAEMKAGGYYSPIRSLRHKFSDCFARARNDPHRSVTGAKSF